MAGAGPTTPPPAEEPPADEPLARVTPERVPPVLRGRVTNEDGAGVPGAQVYVPGTTLGALTEGDGAFVLQRAGAGLADSVVLEVAMIGYRLERRALDLGADAGAGLDIRLTEQALALEAVVVTGTSADRERAAEAGDASVTAAASVDPSALDWSELPRQEAETRLGCRLVLPDGAEPERIELGIAPDAPGGPTPVAARYVVGAGPDGDEVTLVQSRLPVEPGEGGPAEGYAAATRRIGEVWVRAAGPVPTAALDALLERLR